MYLSRSTENGNLPFLAHKTIRVLYEKHQAEIPKRILLIRKNPHICNRRIGMARNVLDLKDVTGSIDFYSVLFHSPQNDQI